MSIADARLAALEARLAATEARLAALEARLSGSSVPSGGGSSGSVAGGPPPIADDSDLDSEWGNPVMKKDPKKWVEQGGESFVGCHMSECPAEYLAMVAGLYDWMASKDEEQNRTYTKNGKELPTAPFIRKNAARARGWARRNASQAAAPQSTTNGHAAIDDNDIPF